MNTRFTWVILVTIITGISCSKSSIIEGVDTPYKYQNYDGYKGWLQVYVRKGGLAENCELKIYEGVHYLGKVNSSNIVTDSESVNCGDGRALQIAMPPGTYVIDVTGDCGGLSVTKTVTQLYCTPMELR